MMAANISSIRDEVARLITLSTPDVEPGLAFKEVSSPEPLEAQPLPARPFDSMRGFHVLSDLHAGVVAWSPYPELLGMLSVRVRYIADRTRTSLVRLHDMASADCARIHRDTCEPVRSDAYSGLAHFINAEQVGSAFVQVPDREGLWLLLIDLQVHYILGD